MLIVADDLSTIALAAGEPLLLDVQFRDADGTVPPASSRAFVLSFYRPDRTTVQVIAGVMLTDESGDFFRFVREGTFSEELLGQTLTVELAERMRNGRYVVTKGAINVASSAAGVLSLGTASIGRVLTRIIVRDAAKLGDPPIFSQTRMRYNSDGTPPLPVFSTKPSLGHDGTPQVGEQITLNPGVHNGTSTAQQFLLAGAPINGATGLAYIPIASDEGKALSAAVTAKGPGGERTEFTAAVIVAAPSPTPTPTPPASGMLNALTLSNTGGTVGQAFTGTVGNGYAGSAYLRTLAATAPAGLSATGNTVSGTPTQAASAIVLTEALYETAGDASTIAIAPAAARVVVTGPATIAEGNAVAIVSVTGPATIAEGNPSGIVSVTGSATITEGN